MSLTGALIKMREIDLTTRHYTGAIFHLGTNDFSEGAPTEEIVDRALDIIKFMKETTPKTRLAFALILPRPQDSDRDPEAGVQKEEDRRTLNSALKFMCMQQGVIFANCITAVKTKKKFDIKMYADDHLHLNDKGVAKLAFYYQGITAALMDKNSTPTPKGEGDADD
jgi:lysophospholipase L1-like esterase